MREEDLIRFYKKGHYWYFGTKEYQQMINQIVDKFISYNIKSILDVGCWNGHLLKQFIKRKYDIDYTGIDLCKEAIDEARLKYKPIASFFWADYNDFEMDREFDAIYFGGIFYYIKPEDQEKFIKRYIDIFGPRIIIIQDLLSTCIKIHIKPVEIIKLKLDIKLNAARRKRKILIYD